MEAEIVPGPQGTEIIVMREGNHIWEVPIRALTSWGQLLGITDPAEVLDYIINYDDPSTPGDDVWPPLYEAMHEGLEQLARAGVPPEHMATLIDPEFESPIPGPRTTKKLKTNCAKARERFKKNPTKGAKVKVSEFRQVLDLCEGKLDEDRVKFMDSHSPTLKLERRKRDVPEPLTVLPVPTTAIPPNNPSRLNALRDNVAMIGLDAGSIQAWASSNEGDTR